MKDELEQTWAGTRVTFAHRQPGYFESRVVYDQEELTTIGLYPVDVLPNVTYNREGSGPFSIPFGRKLQTGWTVPVPDATGALLQREHSGAPVSADRSWAVQDLVVNYLAVTSHHMVDADMNPVARSPVQTE